MSTVIPVIQSEQIAEDLFILSSGNTIMAYSPIREKAFQIRQGKGVDVIKNYFQDGSQDQEVRKFLQENGLLNEIPIMRNRIGKPYHPVHLALSLTSGCNLRCYYCYARAGEIFQTMSWAIAEKAIREAVEESFKLKLKSFKLLFHGGGEALVEFDLVKRSTILVEELWKGKTRFSMVTNATLITEEIAEWFKEHKFKLSISLDGPKDVHDSQRPKANGSGSFDDCIRGMLLLKKASVPYNIRATITANNINRIKELILIAKALECGLKIEPIIITGRAEDGMEDISTLEFYNAILEGEQLAKELNVRFSSTYLHDLGSKTEFCYGNGEFFCVLPDGKVSSCTRVTRVQDDLAETFIIGEFDSNLNLVVDQGKIARLRNLSIANFKQCKDCFAKWYCVGGCHHCRLSNGGDMPDSHCQLVRALLFTQLEKICDSNGKEEKYNA